jgi:uncharacterized protein (TIGR03435 family)
VSGVTGANLKNRIAEIMTYRAAQNLNVARKLLLTATGFAAVAAPVTIGLLNAPSIHAQSESVLATPALPKFEVASIKPAAPGGLGMLIKPSPGGRLDITNMPLKQMIVIAWNVQPFQISGGPSWFDSDRYDIAAKPAITPKGSDFRLMLQSLLFERFHLAIHRETKELPLYALVTAKSDGKLGPGLTRSKEGDCSSVDPSMPPPPRVPGKVPALGCGNFAMGPMDIRAVAVPISDLAPLLSGLLGRTVVDKTGLDGKFDVSMEWTADENRALQLAPDALRPPPSDTTGSSIFTALQEKLGLRLQSQKGPVTVLVIDHVERPTEN